MPEYQTTPALFHSVHRAMLGNVDRRVVALTAGMVGTTVHLRSYVEGAVTSDDLEIVQFIGTEVITDFLESGITDIVEDCRSVDDAPLEMFAFWAFFRADGYRRTL